MPAILSRALLGQYEASLAMLRNCILACPSELWDLPVAKYPFWLVAYHVLYCTDGNFARTQDAWRTHPKFHPGGQSDIDDEYPSRRFTPEDLCAYVEHCLTHAREALAAETTESFEGPSGFERLKFSRAELYLHNLRHVQHHTGQLSAFLHRAKVPTPWVKSGWTQ